MSDSELVKSETTAEMVGFTKGGVQLRNLDEAWRYASLIAKGGDMCPSSFRGKPEAVLAAIQRGAELGLNPMQALTSITVIKGTPTLSGETLLALMNQPGVMKKGKRTKVGWRETGIKELEGFVWSWRDGDDEPLETVFTQAEAVQMKLWGRTGRDGGSTPWVTMPGVMLQWRAVAKHSRRYYSDVSKGLYMTSEMQEVHYPHTDAAPERDVTPPSVAITGASDPLLHGDLVDPPASAAEPVAFSAGDEPADVEPEVDPETGEVIPDFI
jgi:hypothetical protein